MTVSPLKLPKPGLDLGPLLGRAAVPLADALGELALPLDRQHLRDLRLVPAEVGALEVLFCFGEGLRVSLAREEEKGGEEKR